MDIPDPDRGYNAVNAPRLISVHSHSRNAQTKSKKRDAIANSDYTGPMNVGTAFLDAKNATKKNYLGNNNLLKIKIYTL